MSEQPGHAPATDSSGPSGPPRRRAAAKPDVKKSRRSAHWAPDPRWAHPVALAAWIYTLAFLPWIAVPVPAVCILGAGCGVVAALRARSAFPRVDYGDQLADRMTGLALAAGLAAAVWLWRAGTASPLAALGWLIAGAVPLGLIYAVLRSSAPKWARKVDAAEQAQREQDARDVWNKILSDVGVKLQVVESQETRAGMAIGVGPSTERAVPLSELKAKIPEITTRASMLLGREGVTVRDGDISVEGTDASHVHLIHVRTNHVLEQDIPFEPLGHPSTAADPVDIGLYEDGRPVQVQLVGAGGVHSLFVGATGSGKTTTTQSYVGRYAETSDVVQGVIASDKLIPLTWPWIRPWCQGVAPRPGIDFAVGQDPRLIMEMLAGLYRLMKDRNTRLPDSGIFPISPAEPAVLIWVEETADIIDRAPRVTVEGRSMTFSALIEGFTRSGRSAEIGVELLNQYALVEKFGQHGPEIFRNTTLRTALRTMSSYDGTATLPGLTGMGADTTKLRHHSMLIQPNTDNPRVMPAKAYAFDDGEIGELAVATSGHRPDLGAHEAAIVGEAWIERWVMSRCPELVETARREGLPWPDAAAAYREEHEMDPDRPTGRRDELDEELDMLMTMHSDGVTGPQISPHRDESSAVGDLPSAEQGIADIEAATAGAGRPTLPEPLDAVMRALEGQGAPSDFVSTRQLAVVLGRVAAGAGDEAIDAAAAELGREMAKVDKELRTDQRREGAARVRGYEVATLRKVAARIARGDH